jgi:hypothetical protein
MPRAIFFKPRRPFKFGKSAESDRIKTQQGRYKLFLQFTGEISTKEWPLPAKVRDAEGFP